MAEKQQVRSVGGQEAGYLFEFREDGVYLTVYPNEEGGILFELSDMQQILTEYGADAYDAALLGKVIRSAEGTPYRIAEHFVLPEEEAPPQPKEMKYVIEVSKDYMEVKVRLDYRPGTVAPAFETIMDALREKKVVYGIDEAAIRQGLANEGDFVAARGTPQENGRDAEIKRNFSLQEKGKPAIMKYDKVDYKNLNLFVIARKGQILAERIPNTTGTPGRTVFGNEVKPKAGKAKPLPIGKNTEVKDEHFLIAAIDGQIVDNGSKINVDPQLSIKDDVGVGTGDIDFVGAVDINGSVQAGFKVKATGDIHIKGMVNGGTVSGCNVYIAGGVQGLNRGTITAEEDVRAGFAEGATIEAGNAIFIEDVALHSELRAGRLLSVEGKRGLIAGGYVAAGKEIRAKIIGNQAYIATKVVVGVNPMIQRKYQETCRSYAASKKKLSQLTKTLNTLGKVDISKLPPHRAAQISEMTRSKFPLAAQVEQEENLIHELEAQMAQMKEGCVRVSDKLYPGTKIVINSIMKNVQVEEQHCALTVVDDQVQSNPY